jgi:uncharacterized phage protein (predicted DNA packaging)
MGMALIDDVKQYIRVDDDTDDAQIIALIQASSAYLTNAGIGEEKAEKPLYKLAQMMLVGHWYDNREPTGNATKLAHGLAGIILQLQCEVGDDG